VEEAGGGQQDGALTRRALLGSGFAAGAALALVPWWAKRGAHAATAGTAATASGAGPVPTPVATPAMVRRAEWGADETRRGAVEFDETVEKLVVHHTAIDDGSGDWIRQVREIYESEIANGYRDIAYHFLVDPNGVVYEGRWARDYPAGVLPDGQDTRGWSVRGGHARGHNPRTIGIALLGDYTRAVPTDAALASMLGLLVWKCARWNIDPMGTSTYLNVHGGSETFANIVPHGQIRATECPGAHLDALVPALRRDTASQLAQLSGSTGHG
jgi:hypothetical protein